MATVVLWTLEGVRVTYYAFKLVIVALILQPIVIEFVTSTVLLKFYIE
jgi:hypothetical protein